MSKKYTKKFLISELQRFIEKNGKNPKQINMQIKFGYPSYATYRDQFGSWNDALTAAGLEVNQYQEINRDVHKVNTLRLKAWIR